MMKLRQKTKTYDRDYGRRNKEQRNSDNSDEEMELFIKSRSKRPEVSTIEKVIEDGDTLQSLAIRYGCTIGDLKRLNNIFKENEIFAKRIIKVPHKPFTMALAGVHVSGRSSPNSANQTLAGNLIDIDSINTKLNNNIFLVPNDPANEVNRIIFNSQINQKQFEQVQEEGSCDEEVHLLPSSDGEMPKDDLVVSTLSSRTDADISWVGLIVWIVILICVISLVYLFYIAEHIEDYQRHGS